MDTACRLAAISRAGYYRDWQQRSPKQAHTALRDRIQQLSLAHRRYGTRRITNTLRQEGMLVGRKLVSRLMREDNLLVLRKRKFVITTDSLHSHAIYRNLTRDFKATAVNQLWVADITYIRLQESFVYLAVILDAYSRRVVGWSLTNSLAAELVLEALDRALADRTVPDGIIHHSDRGVQYCCHPYVERLKAAGFVISMSRTGNPYDNAIAESFMHTLKCEEVYLTRYRDLEDARQQIAVFLEDYYNTKRAHSSLNYLSPSAFEESGA